MFKVNKIEVKWRENFSIEELLEEVKENKEILSVFGYSQIIVVNDEILSSIDKNNYIINKGDEIKIMPLLGGG